MTRKTSVAAALALGTALVFGTTACTALSPIATEESYNPSDGVTIISGSVTVNNVLLITEDGQTARVIGRVTNKGSADQTITLQVRGATTSTLSGSVQAGKSVDLGADQIVNSLGVQPGATVPVYLQAGTSTGQQVDVPVLNGDLEQYASLVPTPSASDSASSLAG